MVSMEAVMAAVPHPLVHTPMETGHSALRVAAHHQSAAALCQGTPIAVASNALPTWSRCTFRPDSGRVPPTVESAHQIHRSCVL